MTYEMYLMYRNAMLETHLEEVQSIVINGGQDVEYLIIETTNVTIAMINELDAEYKKGLTLH